MSSTPLKLVPAVVALLLGLVIAGLSLHASLTVGSGDRLRSETLEAGQVQALTLNEGMIPFRSTTAHIEVASEAPVFVGVANAVDVNDYLATVPVEEVTEVRIPGGILHREIPGDGELSGDPAQLDWWIDGQEGTSVTHSFDVDAEPRTVVVLAADGGDIAGTTVTVTVDTTGVFGYGLLGLSLAALLLGLAAFLALTWWFDRLRVPRRVTGSRRSAGMRRRERNGDAKTRAPRGNGDAGRKRRVNGSAEPVETGEPARPAEPAGTRRARR